MKDISAILESMERRRAALSDVAKINKGTIFDALAESGLTRVHVTFDGEGDSGQIDNLAGYVGDVLTKLPDLKLTLKSVSWSDNQIVAEERSMNEAIEQLCYDFLEQEHGGWENNDGAFGEFALDVAARTVELEFNGRYTDVHTTTHTF
jgi:hypothetical protein